MFSDVFVVSKWNPCYNLFLNHIHIFDLSKKEEKKLSHYNLFVGSGSVIFDVFLFKTMYHEKYIKF